MWSSGTEHWARSVCDVVQVDAARLTVDRFRREFVNVCQPVLVRNATRHWPAFTHWHDDAYLDDALGREHFAVHREPVVEMRWRERHWPEKFAGAFNDEGSATVSFAALRDLVERDEIVFAYAVGIESDTALAALRSDVGGFDFVPDPRRPHYYKPLRAFVHGRSYTDWHYHPDDSTLMCQFGRTKTVHLLPPDDDTWDVFFEIARHKQRIGDSSADEYPKLCGLEPRQAVVEPGDALYIPPNWWHAVSCALRGLTAGRRHGRFTAQARDQFTVHEQRIKATVLDAVDHLLAGPPCVHCNGDGAHRRDAHERGDPLGIVAHRDPNAITGSHTQGVQAGHDPLRMPPGLCKRVALVLIDVERAGAVLQRTLIQLAQVPWCIGEHGLSGVTDVDVDQLELPTGSE